MFSLKNPELVHKAYLKKIVLPEYPFLSFVKQIFIVHQNVFENHMIFCLLCLPFQFQSFNTIWTFLSPKKHCFKSIVLSLCLNVSFQIGDLQTIWHRVAPPPLFLKSRSISGIYFKQVASLLPRNRVASPLPTKNAKSLWHF